MNIGSTQNKGKGMQRKWKPVEIENIVNENFDRKVYNQLLEELAEIIYSEICQLQKIDSKSCEKTENFLQRTGSHG